MEKKLVVETKLPATYGNKEVADFNKFLTDYGLANPTLLPETKADAEMGRRIITLMGMANQKHWEFVVPASFSTRVVIRMNVDNIWVSYEVQKYISNQL